MDGADPGSGAAGAPDGPPLAPAERRWPLRILAALVVLPIAAAFAASLAFVLVMGTGRRPAEARGPDEIFALSVVSDGALLVVLLLVAARARLRASDLGFRAPRLSSLGDAAAVAVGLWLVSIAVNAVAVRAFGPHPQSLVVTLGAHRGVAAYVLDLLSSALVAPIAEETLFRGVIFGGLAQRLPLWLAASASALLFAAFHGIGVLLPIFVLGLGLAYVYARTRTIWASMLAHALVNGVSVTLLFIASGQ